jgi:hypothetical protein
VSHWYELREQHVLAQRLDVLQREHQPTQLMLRQLVDMRQQLASLDEQERIARELEQRRHALTVLDVVGQAAQKTGGRLRVSRFELTNFQGQQQTPAAGAPVGEAGGLLLRGESLDNPAVAELLEGLQSAGIFSRVDVALKEREDAHATLRDYEVRCEF